MPENSISLRKVLEDFFCFCSQDLQVSIFKLEGFHGLGFSLYLGRVLLYEAFEHCFVYSTAFIRWRGENSSCSVWEPGLSWFVTMARIPFCVQCGTRQNPCHCKVVGPTLGVVAFIIAAVVEWPVGAVVWCFRHAKGRRIMAHPDRVVYPRVSSAIPFWRTSFTSSSAHLLVHADLEERKNSLSWFATDRPLSSRRGRSCLIL